MNIQSAQDLLLRFLKEKKLRITRERLIILKEIMQTTGHFDADGLFMQLKSHNIKVTRATVYNTIDILVDCKLISRYRFGKRQNRYEKILGKPRHDHMICLGCGDIIEFVHKNLDSIKRKVCRENKFTPHSSTFQIFGICRKCRIKK